MMFIVFLLEMVGAGYMLDNGIRYSKIEGWLRDKFMQLINEMDYSMKAARIMNIVQEYVSNTTNIKDEHIIIWHKVLVNRSHDHIS